MTAITSAAMVRSHAAAGGSRGWYEDLLTDWIPDALGGFGIDLEALSSTPPPADRPTQRIRVHTVGGTRIVPLASLEFRAWAHRTVDDVLGKYESNLHASVCGYRDADTPYRKEWRRLTDLLAECQDGHWIRVDIEGFFGSVDENHPALAEALPVVAREVMSTTRSRYGMSLLPGHRWSRRLANLVLAPVDAAIAGLFVRWQDDYWLHVDSATAGARAVEALTKAAAELNLTVRPYAGVKRDSLVGAAFPDVAALSQRQRAVISARAVADGRPAFLKYLLRRLAYIGDPSLIVSLPSMLEENPVLGPRAAMYLDACAAAGHAVEEPLGTLLECSDQWIQARLLAVVARRPNLASTVSEDTLNALGASSLVAVRALVARIQHHCGLNPVAADRRTNSVLRSHAPEALARWRPMIETTL